MSKREKRKISTFDQSLTPEQVKLEKRRGTVLGQALEKADKLEPQTK
jgi:hypothetical protein